MRVNRRLSSHWHTPLCNGDPSTCTWLGPVPIPLCWRCSALWAGSLVGYALNFKLDAADAAGLVAPCTLHGIARYLFSRTCSNRGRILTGFPAGYALGSLVSHIQ
ncbi:MAG: hypothetical protein CVV12_06000 [Gammaproteobacteria bacterium HGW-Gammaproteobacteria-2]|nr:MAG: hypothetical protein CVV12_06000 [Gammaproteobacteria bacterium HGW-Gammaproteobacteria-2]